MKPIEKSELYENLKSFLKTRGIELQEGSYTHRMEQGCGLLADVVNLSQQTIEKAKDKMDKRLDQMRQVIHERTAPKASPQPTQAKQDTSAGPAKKSMRHPSAKAGNRGQRPGKKKTK
jgi:hypothetical protein